MPQLVSWLATAAVGASLGAYAFKWYVQWCARNTQWQEQEQEHDPEPAPAALQWFVEAGDTELAAVLQQHGVCVVCLEPGQDTAGKTVVRRPRRTAASSDEALALSSGSDASSAQTTATDAMMRLGTVAAYAALQWYRMSGSMPPEEVLPSLLPLHCERQRSSKPYVDTLALLRVPQLSCKLIAAMASHARDAGATVVVAFESARAMAFGVLVAAHLKVPFVPARHHEQASGMELIEESIANTQSYRHGTTVTVDSSAFAGPADRVVIVDDVVSSGATLDALVRCVSQRATVVACVTLVCFQSTPQQRPTGHLLKPVLVV